MRYLTLFILTIFFLSCTQQETTTTPEVIADHVIYGADNRRDYYQERNKTVIYNMDKVAAMVMFPDMLKQDSIYLMNTNTSFGDAFRLCRNERFYDQPSTSLCTTFAVNDSTFITAGHCVTGNSFKNTYIVYGYKMFSPDSVKTVYEDSLVFKIKNVRKRVVSSTWDYAVLTSDRAVPKDLQLPYSNKNIKLSDRLYVIGYPSGLPVKSAGGARTRYLRGQYLKISLDTYGGNSGSPVFDNQTHEVKGILIRGETDFVRRGNCTVSKRCPDNGCAGEDVVYLNRLIKFF